MDLLADLLRGLTFPFEATSNNPKVNALDNKRKSIVNAPAKNATFLSQRFLSVISRSIWPILSSHRSLISSSQLARNVPKVSWVSYRYR